MGGKRRSETGQLKKEEVEASHQHGESAGTFARASEEELQRRRRVRARPVLSTPSTSSSPSTKNVFSGVNLSAPERGGVSPPTPAAPTFSFNSSQPLSKVSDGPTATAEAWTASDKTNMAATSLAPSQAVDTQVPAAPDEGAPAGTPEARTAEQAFWEGNWRKLGEEHSRVFAKLPQDFVGDATLMNELFLIQSVQIQRKIRLASNTAPTAPDIAPSVASPATAPPAAAPQGSPSAVSLGNFASSSVPTSTSSAGTFSFAAPTQKDDKSPDPSGNDKAPDTSDRAIESDDPDFDDVEVFDLVIFYRYDEDSKTWKIFTNKSNSLRVQKSKQNEGKHRMVVRNNTGRVLVNMMITEGMAFSLASVKGKKGQKLGKVTFKGLNVGGVEHEAFLIKAQFHNAEKLKNLLSGLVPAS